MRSGMMLDDARVELPVLDAEARRLLEVLGGALGAAEAELEQAERGLRSGRPSNSMSGPRGELLAHRRPAFSSSPIAASSRAS